MNADLTESARRCMITGDNDGNKKQMEYQLTTGFGDRDSALAVRVRNQAILTYDADQAGVTCGGAGFLRL